MDYLAIGNDELDAQPAVHPGLRVRCQRDGCDDIHPLRAYGVLLTYECPGVGSYLAGLDGRLLPGVAVPEWEAEGG